MNNQGQYRFERVRLGEVRTEVESEESDEAEVGADGDPERRERVLDETEGQVDDGRSEGEHSDDPEVDGQVRETVETLDVTNTLQRSTSQRCQKKEKKENKVEP
jgi:hypothetical protein